MADSQTFEDHIKVTVTNANISNGNVAQVGSKINVKGSCIINGDNAAPLTLDHQASMHFVQEFLKLIKENNDSKESAATADKNSYIPNLPKIPENEEAQFKFTKLVSASEADEDAEPDPDQVVAGGEVRRKKSLAEEVEIPQTYTLPYGNNSLITFEVGN